VNEALVGLWRRTGGDESGGLFILTALVVVLLISLLGAALFDISRLEATLWSGDVTTTQALYCTEAGLSRTLGDVARVTALGTVGAGTAATLATDAVTTGNGHCATTVVVNNDVGGQRYLTATATMPNGLQKGVRVSLNLP